MRITPFSMNLENGISAKGLDARDGKNSFSLLDVQGPKSEMDKLFGPPGGFDSKNPLGSKGADGKGGQDAAKGKDGQQGQGNPFSELANAFGKDSPIGKFLNGIGNMLGGNKGADGKGGDKLAGGGDKGGAGGPGGAEGGGGKPGEAGGAGGDTKADGAKGADDGKAAESNPFNFNDFFKGADKAADSGSESSPSDTTSESSPSDTTSDSTDSSSSETPVEEPSTGSEA